MDQICKKELCTVSETGRCMLNNDPATCPERAPLVVVASIERAADQEPVAVPFPVGLTLDDGAVSELCTRDYCHLVGILGAPDSGKTATLVSLYLLVANNRLAGFEYRDSRTLMALEQISRGARRWNDGSTPEQMTAHTERPTERAAGYLHVRLHRAKDGRLVDLLLPDLPGEWTTSLIDRNRADRWAFLRAADCIWIMIDGDKLTSIATRMSCLHRVKLLLNRVAKILGPRVPNTILVVTRRDKADVRTADLDDLVKAAAAIGIPLTYLQVAAFDEGGKAAPGEGISDLVEQTLNVPGESEEFWRIDPPRDHPRAMLRYGDGAG